LKGAAPCCWFRGSGTSNVEQQHYNRCKVACNFKVVQYHMAECMECRMHIAFRSPSTSTASQ